MTFVVRGDNPTLRPIEFAQIAASDAQSKHEYVLVVACTPDCFVRNHSTIQDILNLSPFEKEGIIGAIAGRALYEGKLDFKAAMRAAKGG